MPRELTEVEALTLALRERELQLAYMVGVARDKSERLRVLQRTLREVGRSYLLGLFRARMIGRFPLLAAEDSNPDNGNQSPASDP